MVNKAERIVKDSMGEMRVPEDALYGAQTARACENFPISGITLPKSFIEALALIKAMSAKSNFALGLLDEKRANVIYETALDVSNGKYDKHFPIDIFQTGSGTSTNMNANEVIARVASLSAKMDIHPNDHVNMSQSSNDVIPTAIHVSASLLLHNKLIPSLQHLHKVLWARSEELKSVTKTGRTHLMDAMPVTLGQELSGWMAQINNNLSRLKDCQKHIQKLALGGTAVGTGINAPEGFSQKVCTLLSEQTHISFTSNDNYFEGLSCQDAAVALSGQCKVVAVSLMKIANDLRWMNSGPLAGISEIALPALQPGSSIMPGKINPVIPEAVMMVSAQVIGNDSTITIAGQAGNFQLNVMLPVIAYNLLQSLEILSNAARVLADKAIQGFTVNLENIQDKLAKNPILATALNTVIGYEMGAKIVKKAYAEKRSLREIAEEMTDLSKEDLDRLLDPQKLTHKGIPK